MRVASIFTHENAREVDGVIDELRGFGIAVDRYNLCQFPEGLPLSIKLDPEIKTEVGHSGWIHNTGEWSFSVSLTGLEREVAQRECSAFMRGFTESTPANWLNSPDAIQHASNKPIQLRLVRSLGIKTPATLITNDASKLRHFALNHERIVMKSLDAGFLHYGPGDPLKFFTKEISGCLDEIANDLPLSPAIFQELVPRMQELRITVVDGHCYTIAVDCTELPKGVVDIRQLDYRKEKDRFSRPTGVEAIENWSREITAKLGLAYAGLDWALNSDGTAYFLEANACGSFKWFELCGAGDITKAIARALNHRCS